MARISEAEMERIMAQYGASVKRMCRLQLGDGHLAEDAAQETFIKVWRSGGGFRGECTEKTWILRIAINACRDIRRGAWLLAASTTLADGGHLRLCKLPDLQARFLALQTFSASASLLTLSIDCGTLEKASLFDVLYNKERPCEKSAFVI